MNELKELDELWGTTIYNIEIDYFLNCSRFYIRSGDPDGNMQFYELKFERMFSFHIQNEDSHVRTLIDLAEIYYEKKKNHEFNLVIWHDSYTIDIECEDWKLTLLEKYDEND